jgi:N-acetylglucosaminyl-diphospho-decaprenol L-rhamnosyltransferase
VRYTVVIPVFNQLPYTQQCVDSLLASGVPPEAILVIDNASTDETPCWLASRPDLRSVRNRANLGCGGAWTQGALLAGDADWVVLLNNDVLVGPRAMDAMLDAAERLRLGVVSPALLEGPLDYDFQAFAPAFLAAMGGEVRLGRFLGVCFAVRRTVFETVGYLDTDRSLGGHEDTEFLLRCRRHGIPIGIVGAAVLHHFGSVTQDAIKRDTGQSSLGDRRLFYRKVGMSWLARKRYKARERRQARAWARDEQARRGMTLHMKRVGGAWRNQ